MLVQFKMKNVLSFKEETIFDMTAISAYKEHVSNLIDIEKRKSFSGWQLFMELMLVVSLILFVQCAFFRGLL